MFQSNLKFFVKETISSTAVATDTFLISDDFELWQAVETSWQTVSITIKNSSDPTKVTQVERMEITATWWEATIVRRWLTQEETATEDISLNKQWSDGSVCAITALAFDLIDKTDAKPDRYTWPEVADTTARDALYPSPVWSEEVAVNSLWGLKQRYNSITAQWETFWTSTPVPFASETVAWTVEISDDTEFSAWTDTWATWAFTSAKNSQIQAWYDQIVEEAAVLTASTETDKFLFWDDDDSWSRKSITKANLREDLAWSTTLKGTWELATDAEVATWTSEILVVNPKQIKDWFINRWLDYTLVSTTTWSNESTGKALSWITLSANVENIIEIKCTLWSNIDLSLDYGAFNHNYIITDTNLQSIDVFDDLTSILIWRMDTWDFRKLSNVLAWVTAISNSSTLNSATTATYQDLIRWDANTSSPIWITITPSWLITMTVKVYERNI